MRKSLTRKERLRTRSEIKGLFADARRVEGGGLKLLYRENGAAGNRFAVVVGRGCGGAVRRNREKRVTREAYRSLKEIVAPGYDLLFLVLRFGESFAERRAAMGRLLGRAGLRNRAD
jgi:ribonuclease P protein component